MGLHMQFAMSVWQLISRLAWVTVIVLGVAHSTLEAAPLDLKVEKRFVRNELSPESQSAIDEFLVRIEKRALEIIEAHWLFGATSEQIEAVIHRESLVHGLVEFIDGSMVAQLAPPDMKMPIQYALTYPQRRVGAQEGCNWKMLSSLHFEPIDTERFPAIGLAREVIQRGGTAGAIFSAANEIAVQGFLNQSLPFGSIVRIVKKTLETIAVSPASSLEAVTAADTEARNVAQELIASYAGKEFA